MIDRLAQLLYTDRAVAAMVFLACAAVLGIGCWLTPASQGIGTHTQLGMAPCGMLQVSGMPCATCGMTTAVTYAAHGMLWRSFVTQPAGALFALACAAGVIIGGYAVLTGMPVKPLLGRIARPRWFAIMGVAVAVAWAYKVVVVLGA